MLVCFAFDMLLLACRVNQQKQNTLNKPIQQKNNTHKTNTTLQHTTNKQTHITTQMNQKNTKLF